jgi:hypothetical protein
VCVWEVSVGVRDWYREDEIRARSLVVFQRVWNFYLRQRKLIESYSARKGSMKLASYQIWH